MSDIRTLVENFTNQLAALVEGQAIAQARAAVEGALGVRRPGRPAKLLAVGLGKKARKKPPRQLCPVPGCKNSAAPVFGMVCSDHKDVAKAKIKKYRQARKAQKLGIKPAKAVKRAKPKAVAKSKKIRRATFSKRRTKTVTPAAASAPVAAAA